MCGTDRPRPCATRHLHTRETLISRTVAHRRAPSVHPDLRMAFKRSGVRLSFEFGTVTLTAAANANDPELRRTIFDPIPRVDGIDPSDYPLIQVRGAIYLLSGRKRRAAPAG